DSARGGDTRSVVEAGLRVDDRAHGHVRSRSALRSLAHEPQGFGAGQRSSGRSEESGEVLAGARDRLRPAQSRSLRREAAAARKGRPTRRRSHHRDLVSQGYGYEEGQRALEEAALSSDLTPRGARVTQGYQADHVAQ